MLHLKDGEAIFVCSKNIIIHPLKIAYIHILLYKIKLFTKFAKYIPSSADPTIFPSVRILN